MNSFAKQRMSNNVACGAVLAVFLGALFFSLFFHLPVGMDMADSMGGCPFMAHGEALCSMNLFDHVSSWEAAFLAVPHTVVLLIFALIAAVVLLRVAPNMLLRHRIRKPLPLRVLIERVYSFSYRPLQEQFSNGILHPKLF